MEEQCCICFQNRVLVPLICKHTFCSQCILRLDRCALCRSKLKLSPIETSIEEINSRLDEINRVIRNLTRDGILNREHYDEIFANLRASVEADYQDRRIISIKEMITVIAVFISFIFCLGYTGRYIR